MAEVKLVLGIEIEGNKLLLTESAARQLYMKLKEIFEDKHSITYIPYPVGYPVYVPQQPVWYVQPINSPYIVISQPQLQWYNTCGSSGNISYTYSNF